MSASVHANGGSGAGSLDLPDFRDYALPVSQPGGTRAESMRQLGAMLAELYRRNPHDFRLFCPDETNSNRLGAVFEVSDRAFAETTEPTDVAISRDGRVMEVLSEHNCHGWFEGYTLTGRHGMFATYEAFAMVSAAQSVQHGKWLEEAAALPPAPDANCLLSVADHAFRSRSYVNLLVIDKQPQLQWLSIDEAEEHCARGASIWSWPGATMARRTLTS